MSSIPIGVDVDGEGAHPSAWRAADHPPTDLFTPELISERIAALDASAAGFASFSDHARDGHPDGVLARLDTVETASFAAASSARIGLIAEVNPVHAEPYHLANQLNTLDWASRGRGAWLVRAVDSIDIAAGYGRTPHPDDLGALREARDVVSAVRRLWDTWEDDVLIADIAGGRFLDLERWHYADAVGESFRIKGPGLLPRPPQGQLVVWAEEPDPILAPLVDVAVVTSRSGAQLVARAAAARAAGIPRVVAAVEVALDARGESATQRLHVLDRIVPWSAGDRLRVVGSPAEVAEHLAELAAHVDGIRLHPAVLDVDVPVIAAEVLPRLRDAGVLRAPGADETLRDQFGLARPDNVFALAREGR